MEYLTDEVMNGSPCCERSFPNFSWVKFFREITSALNGRELCDCWRQFKTNKFTLAVENRRYFNSELQTQLIFLWLGTTPTYMRKDFASFPFKLICDISLPSCLPVVTKEFDILSVAEMVENATVSFKPDLFIMNWGHHHAHTLESEGGKHIYQNLTQTIARLKSRFHTRFVFKMTTPFCETPLKDERQLYLHCDLVPVQLLPTLVSEKLIADKLLEKFDTPAYLHLLANALPSFHDPKTGALSITETTPIGEAKPLYWDRLHPYCWVLTQLNQVMIAKDFTLNHSLGIVS
jgi:hypothetical protein